MKTTLIAIFICIIAQSFAVENSVPLKQSTSNINKRSSENTKELQASASDRTFLIGKDYGNSGYGYANYPGNYGYSSYFNRGYYPNSVYRGYQSGLGINSGLGYYGNSYGNYNGLGTGYNYYSNGVGYNNYDDGVYGTRGYNRFNSLDGSYGGYVGSSVNAYYGPGGSYGNYPSGYRGYGNYFGTPSGYRGYS